MIISVLRKHKTSGERTRAMNVRHVKSRLMILLYLFTIPFIIIIIVIIITTTITTTTIIVIIIIIIIITVKK